jgi:hypothetical protein
MEWTDEVRNALLAPFADGELDVKPQSVSGQQACAVFYVDARTIMRRLDEAVGVGNWSFDFDLLSPDGKAVKGRLTVLGVTKCDAGESEKEEEPLKSAVSDALKRAAVHFGVGRYLYHLPRVWAPYDPQKRRFTERPRPEPQAVQKALMLAGYTGAPTSAQQRQERPQPRDNGPAPEAAQQPRKSVWAAGGTPAGGPPRVREESPAPETSGDRAAVRERVTSAAETQQSMPVAGGAEELVCSVHQCGTALSPKEAAASKQTFGAHLCGTHRQERAATRAQ